MICYLRYGTTVVATFRSKPADNYMYIGFSMYKKISKELTKLPFIAEIVLHDFEVFVGDIGVARVGEVFVERLAAIDHRAFALRMAILGDEFVHHDAAEPCFAIRTRFVFIEVFTCADERILDEVFGVFFVVREAERIRHQRVLVAHGFGLE